MEFANSLRHVSPLVLDEAHWNDLFEVHFETSNRDVK
jgi:hypothetical protein